MEIRKVIPVLALGLALVGCGKVDALENSIDSDNSTTEASVTVTASGEVTTAETTTAKTSQKTTSTHTTSTSSTSTTTKATGQLSRNTNTASKTSASKAAAKTTSKQTGNAPAKPASPPTVTTAAPKTEPPKPVDNTLSFKVTKNGVDIYRGAEKTQTIEVDTEELLDKMNESDLTADQLIQTIDVDCNGLYDLFIPHQIGVLNTFGVYYHYNETDDRFEKWDEMQEIDTLATVSSDGKFATKVRYSESEYELRTYGWAENGAPLLKAMEKKYTASDESGDVFIDYYDYTSGSEVLTRRQRILFDDEHKEMGAEEVEADNG